MRAREFIVKEQRTDEIAPVIGAVGGALARGASAIGSAVKQGATNLAVAGAKKLAGTKLGQAAIGAVANAAGEAPPQGQSNASGQAVGTSSAPAGPTTGAQQAAGGATDQKAQADQQKQQQLQAQQQKEFTTNIDKISAQLIAMKQDLIKQQQQPPQ